MSTFAPIEGPATIGFDVDWPSWVHAELGRLGAGRVVVITSSRTREAAEAFLARLAPELGVGLRVYDGAQVPRDEAEAVTAWCEEAAADWVVALGGGSVVGMAKAVALLGAERGLDVKIGAVPTTYAGSERTGIWGLKGPEGKQTGRDAVVRPALVAYDARLVATMPLKLALSSGFNALAHALGSLWEPGDDAVAEEATAAVVGVLEGLKAVADDPEGLEARQQLQYGAALAAAFIERTPLSMHHLLAHVLGGSFGVAHAAAHTAVLPYSAWFNGVAVPDAMERLAGVFGDDPPAALYDLARAHGLPHSLKQLDVAHEDLPRLVARALERGYPNVRPYDEAVLTELVDDAWHARRPSLHSRRRALEAPAQGVHAELQMTERGATLEDAEVVIVGVHGRGAAADRLTRDIEEHTGRPETLTLLAPQAQDNAWYHQPFTKPPEDNQPHLDSALSVLDAAWATASAAVGPGRVAMVGFSQGACLLLAWAKLRDVRPGALVAMSGAQLPVEGDYGNLARSFVHISKSEGDPWIPQDVFDATVAELRAVVPGCHVSVVEGEAHGIHEADGAVLSGLVERLA